MVSESKPVKRYARWLGRVCERAIELLGSASRRIGYPTLVGVPVSAAMLSRVATVSSEQSLQDVAQLLVGGRHEQVPVVENGRPVAVITRDDVAQGLQLAGPNAPVASAPTHHVVTVAPADSIEHVLDKLREHPDRVAVVVDRGTPVGLLTVAMLAAYVQDRTLA